MTNNKYCLVALPLPLPVEFTYISEFPELRIGCVVKVPFGRSDRTTEGWVIGFVDKIENLDYEVKKIEDFEKEPIFNEELLSLAKEMSQFYLCSLGEALNIILPNSNMRKEDIELSQDWLEQKEKEESLLVELTQEQDDVVKEISSGTGKWFYLYGITGSGKSEVFLSLIENYLNKGESVIYLVPEIVLTHQLLEKIENRFPQQVFTLHSHLTRKRKKEIWRQLQQDRPMIVLGARSAIFSPLRNLGLIIMDEEHENSYKAGNTPRYHARQIAFIRSRYNKATFVMGSATPSLESWFLIEKGKVKRLDLTKRINNKPLPEIEVIDMKQSKSLISKKLYQAIFDCRANNGQVILFLNQRGYAKSFICYHCGKTLSCHNCSVNLVYHKSQSKLICHHCGFIEKIPKECPHCQSFDVGYIGIGTEQVQEVLRRSFPQWNIERLDSDIARKKGIAKSILNDFSLGKIDILLGTQMIAKGLNFENVQLVGLVLAETSLLLPDFRASERTFSLITQVSGRAGRFKSKGRVIIQTFQPDNEVIQEAKSYNLFDFYRKELELRETFNFPPYSRMIRFVFRGKNKELVLKEAENWAKELTPSLDYSSQESFAWSLQGPSDCPLEKIANNYRVHILAIAEQFNLLHHHVKWVSSSIRRQRGVYVEIDIDPINLL